jgi:hypothetical protein
MNEELLAALVERQDLGNRLLFGGFGFKGRAWEPVKVPRPRDKEKRTQVGPRSPKEGFRKLMGKAGGG